MPRTDAVFVMPDLSGPEGNAFVLLGRADEALAKAGVSKEGREEFHAQATSSDYENLLITLTGWFTVVRQVREFEVIETIEGLIPGRSSSTDGD